MKVIALHEHETTQIRLAVNNDRAAQKWIYDKHAAKMLSVCRTYIKDLHQAEDALICGFTKVFSNLDKFEHKGSFEGWIRRIVVNECISWLRSHKKLHFIDDQPKYEVAVFDEPTGLDAVEIQELIDQLPAGFKVVFNLYAIEGFKHREIAQMLNISEGTSKSQLSHARKQLQKALEKRKIFGYGTI